MDRVITEVLLMGMDGNGRTARIEGAASCSSPAEEVLRAAREGDVEGVRAMLQQDPALFKV